MPSEWNAARYHELSRPQLEWGRKLVAELALRGDETVLDAGCGSGKVTAELAERLPQGKLVAVDISENMVREARAFLGPRFGARVEVLRSDLQDLPFVEHFDGIFSSAVFHWVPDHDRLARSLYTALRPGGWGRAQCGGGPNLALLTGRALQLAGREEFAQYFGGWKPPAHYEPPEAMARCLKSAGFAEVETWLEPSPVFLGSAERFREFIAIVTLHPYLARLPRPELRERFVEELTRQAAHDDPPFVMDYWRLNLHARRPA